MHPTAARHTLLAQHQWIRNHFSECTTLARRVCDGEALCSQLDAALYRLRRDFAEHNLTETALLRPLLAESCVQGKQLIERMLEEHIAEHVAFWENLAGTTRAIASRMTDLIDELDAHMAAEERTFLSAHVLRNIPQ